jgi:excisionase family DNA binding protein
MLPPMPQEQRMYTSEEAAAAMGVSTQTIRRWVEEKRISAHHVGIRRLIRIEEQALQRLADENKILFRPKP